MAKYEFEWTDEQAAEMAEVLTAYHQEKTFAGGETFWSRTAAKIEAQRPVPLPTKIGAVIRGKVSEMSRERTFVCSGSSGWVEAGGDYYPTPPIKHWIVLSEGVDL